MSSKYWLIVLVLLLTVMKLMIGNKVMIQKKLYMFISLVFCIFIITLLISLIRYTIRDFRESNKKGKLLIVILLILVIRYMNPINDTHAYQQYKKTLMKDDIINNSNQIINGEKLWDTKAREILTSDGSNIDDWWKMESKYTYSTEFDEGKMHYYQNVKTGKVSTFDLKIKVPKPKNLRCDSKDLFWIEDLDKNFIPNKLR